MSEDEARRGEGWLDAMVRLEREGYVLTVNEAMAADILWDGFIRAMHNVAKAATPSL